jgi:hypothetical protein
MATTNPGQAVVARLDPGKSRAYNPRVFQVESPPCKKCHAGSLDFKLFEDLDGTGTDWIQWYCQNEECGYYFNVEIL